MAQSEQNSCQIIQDLTCSMIEELTQSIEQLWTTSQQFEKMEQFIQDIVMHSPLADDLFQTKSINALYTETEMDVHRLWDVLHEDPPEINWWFKAETLSDWLCGDISGEDSTLFVTAWIDFVIDNLQI